MAGTTRTSRGCVLEDSASTTVTHNDLALASKNSTEHTASSVVSDHHNKQKLCHGVKELSGHFTNIL